MIIFPEDFSKITDLEEVLSTVIESSKEEYIKPREVPSEYVEKFMHTKVDDIFENVEYSSAIRPYVMESEYCEDIKTHIETDYLMETISEDRYKRLLRDFNSLMMEAMSEENVSLGAMLPQPGQGKDPYTEEEDDDELEIEEAVIDYINNPTYEYTVYVEGAIKNMVTKVKDTVGSKISINSQILKEVGKKVALKAKIRIAKIKKADPNKLNDLKSELVQVEENIRNLKKGLTPETLQELENATSKMEQAIKKKENASDDNISADELVKGVLDMENESKEQQNTNESVIVVKEAYFGKSSTLEQAENIIGEIMRVIRLNPSGDYTNHPLNKKLEMLFEKQFGVKNMYIIWDRTPISKPSEFSLCSSDILFNSHYIIQKDNRNGFYDKNHVHVAYIRLSVNLITSINFTPEEIMALMLHNLGTNFDGSIYSRFKILLGYVNAVFGALYSLMVGTMLGDAMMAVKPIIAEIISIMMISTNPGHKLLAKLNQLLEKLIDKVPVLKKISLVFGKIENVLYKIGEIGLDVYKIFRIPFFIISAPISQLFSLFGRKELEFADSFAASYGYGAAMASVINKAEASNWIKDMEAFPTESNGFYKMTTDIALFMREVINITLKGGSSGSRIVKIKEDLVYNIKGGDYPKELKKDILKSIDDIESVYRNYTNCDRNDSGLLATAFVRNGVDDLFDGRSDIINQIFPDNTVRSAFGESVDCDYLDRLYDDYQEAKFLLEKAENDNNQSLIRRYENQIKYYEKTIATEEAILTEKADIDKDMKPIIETLNRKGYKTKYSSAGHTQLRKKEDKYRDGIYEGKLYSDARIMFDGDYNFPKAPKYWIWRTVDEKDYLDVDPKAYSIDKGDTPEDAFRKWKASYMGTLKTWVENLPDHEETSGKAEANDTKGRKVALENTEEEMNFDDFFTEMMHEIDNELVEEGYDSLLV